MGLIVDEFAGGGGASTGLEQALGRPVDIAVNHSAVAISVHRANHPATRHFHTSVWRLDPLEAIRGVPVDVAWFSPDCKHFSKAKGGRPVDKNIRGLAWVVLRWAALPRHLRPKVILLENVEEFQDWGPLDRRGKPIKELKGATFRLWVSHLEALGYRIEARVLRACDFGAPTIRKRLFVVARCDGHPIRWPEPTHGAPGSDAVKDGKLLPWRAAAECIDWSLPCPSIFLTREEGRALGVKRPLAEATLRRIARGVARYVIEAKEPFIVGVGGRMGQSPERPASAPFQTLTAKADSCLVVPTLISTRNGERDGQAPRVRDIGSPCATVTAKGSQGALVAAFLAQHNTDMVGHGARSPVSTIVGKGCTQALVASHLINLKGADRRMAPSSAPAPAITAGGLHVGEVRAFLLKYYGTAEGADLSAPLHTATAKERFGLVTVEIAGQPYVIADIGMRMLTPRELFRAQGFPEDYVIETGGFGEPVTKSNQVLLCGNSVCPPVARALAAANAAMYAAGAADGDLGVARND